MIDSTFSNPLSAEFWQTCKTEMLPIHLEVICDVLEVLDVHGGVSSVRSRHHSRGEYSRQGQVSLLEHSINVATICREITDPGFVRNLAVIAGLAHDCGKLPQFHPGKYAAVMHAHWGAVFVSGIVAGRLVDMQAAAVIDAVKNHHLPVGGPVHSVLREADRLARESEHLQVVDSVAQGNPLLLASPIKENGCKGGKHG